MKKREAEDGLQSKPDSSSSMHDSRWSRFSAAKKSSAFLGAKMLSTENDNFPPSCDRTWKQSKTRNVKNGTFSASFALFKLFSL